MPRLRPGRDGEPLPAGVEVFRLALGLMVESKDFQQTGRVPRTVFDLSSGDKASSTPRLSVYASDLTRIAEAWAFLDLSAKYGYSVHISTDQVRTVGAEMAGHCRGHQLVVEWEAKKIQDPQTGMEVLDERPAAKGHAGIAGLSEADYSSAARKNIKRKLAAFAEVRPLPAVSPVFVSRRGRRYHRRGCKAGRASILMCRESARARGITPCRSCNPD
ncbi:MAG: hypothetical protein HY321_17700 [Armatimonadetes bacterium]|nr:hypothetical protein [Armatimonadota bacterium]